MSDAVVVLHRTFPKKALITSFLVAFEWTSAWVSEVGLEMRPKQGLLRKFLPTFRALALRLYVVSLHVRS